MAALFALLAAAVIVLHLGFVAFAAGGALLWLRWRWIPWVHVPAAAWAAYIELSGGICPLTPLENALRARAGLDGYSTDFVARYLLPVLYPDGLTQEAQTVIGLLVAAINVLLYGWVLFRARTRPAGESPGVGLPYTHLRRTK